MDTTTTTSAFGPMELAMVIMFFVWLAAVVACFMRGKPAFGVLGFFFAIFAYVGAVRVAKPGSWYARTFYNGGDDPKMVKAHARFPQKSAPATVPVTGGDTAAAYSGRTS